MFSDIEAHWSKAAIAQLADLNLVQGYPDRTFRPEGLVTRAEFAVLLCNVFSSAKPIREQKNFVDVPQSHWAYEAIQTAVSKGFLVGYPGLAFKPEPPIPRVQVLIAIASHLKLEIPPTVTVSKTNLKLYFDDAQEIPHYALPKLTAALFGYLIVNFPDRRKLRPNQPATRGEVAAILCQTLGIWNTVPLSAIGGGEHWAIAPKFSRASHFFQGVALVSGQLGYDLINLNGQPIEVDRHYQILEWGFEIERELPTSDPLIPVSLETNSGLKYGYLNQEGNLVIPAEWEMAAPFSEGLGLVRKGGKSGYIDPTGQVVIEPQFELSDRFYNGRAAVKVGEKYGYIDTTGHWVIPPELERGYRFSEERVVIWSNGRYGYLDNQGNAIVEPQFEQADRFSDGLAVVRLNGVYGCIDRTGNLVLETPHRIQKFSEGLAAIEMGEAWEKKWGYIDQTGDIAIAPQFYGLEDVRDRPYSPVEPFSEGLAMVRFGPKCGFIDRTGTFVIPPHFSDASSFSHGLARVTLQGEWYQEGRGNTGSGMPAEYVILFRDGTWGYLQLNSAVSKG
ncbi:WG repeat-containing protein [Roseofilum sp. Belize Diploria]|uniref:WG repeat-containing protein n=1 Tax=Roseofilum sp. Belize Diploria TaxID=2821501 RepID=UPI001B290A2A|nr:WG repeat-containing protein [Roseofilum sp. Belize Diploria]MBP0009275.1 WG repeat-containing protein [Roseofilum sp. Belize Diploria]